MPSGSKTNGTHDASSSANEAVQTAPSQPVTLPPNVTIYTSPHLPSFLSATLFTRLSTTASSPIALSTALGSTPAPYCLQHNTSLLIFDTNSNAEQQDLHHEHFREVCLRLREADIGVEYGGCRFDVEGSVLGAGFQVETLSGGGSALIIDLQHGDDDEDDDDDEEEDEDEEGDEFDPEALGEVVSGSAS